ncbi:hypothetical protein KEM48_010379 [Puccinia striiformis f. sp. tritici PST-130]|nr:hypothetical protein KEM48_010379 [Puccinia striiformis f. sp. tritici PST-130]
MADRPRRPRNANAATPLTTRRIIRTNTRIITVSRGQPRRARNAGLRRTEQQEPAERARQASARRLGRRLADKPRTAFSIRLVQYHHHLWQVSAVTTSAFIKSVSAYLDSHTRKPLLNRGSKHKRRELRVPFSHCIDLYLRILTNSKKIYEDGLRLSPTEKWANKCPRCFGPIQNEVKQNPAEPDINLNMDGNYQQRHYHHASKDCPREDHLDPARAEYYSDQLTLSTGEWFAKKFLDCTKANQAASLVLHQLYELANPATPGSNYTNQFFEGQWLLEQNYHLHLNQNREKQRQELGKLLCLQEELDAAWQAESTTAEQGIARAAACRDIDARLRRQRTTIGPHALIDNLNRNQSELLWKAWYSKIDVRQQYLALAKEKQPLLQACCPGEQTTLGTNSNESLMRSLRKRGDLLRNSINVYNRRALDFAAACPTRHAPPTITYDELLHLQPDDAFWNDGLFTNGNEPWAIDANTQCGIRSLASFKRSQEEHRRIGWEVRRAMCWAAAQQDRLMDTLRQLCSMQVPAEGETYIPPNVEALLLHDYLSPLKTVEEKMKSAKVVIHAKLIEIWKLQIQWDEKIIDVFEQTPHQTGDDLVLQAWQQQIAAIFRAMQNGHSSGIPGDLNYSVIYPGQDQPTGDDIVPNEEDGNDNGEDEDQSNEGINIDESDSDSDEGEEEYIEAVEHVMHQTIQRIILLNLAEPTPPPDDPILT